MDYVDNVASVLGCVTPSEVSCYTEEYQTRNFPAVMKSNDGEYVLLFSYESSNVNFFSNSFKNEESDLEGVDGYSLNTFDVNDCVIKCQDVLGLKINEIAKLAGVSRASLDLHRKGSNVKDMSAYHQLYTFVSIVEDQYGASMKNSIRNVLVDRKTLIQHFMRHADDLESTLPFISDVSKKVQEMKILDTNFEKSKLGVRLSRIGKMA